jgi:hypothetical protein
MNGSSNNPSLNRSPAKKAFVLFVIVYLLIYMMPNFFSRSGLFDATNIWIGKHVMNLHTVLNKEPNGSGDTSLAYTSFFLTIITALLLTFLIFVFGRKRTDSSRLYDLTIICCRYYLAFFMLMYGFIKIFDSQFPPPSLYTLEKTYGNSSPMGLLWTFMGSSWPYSAFGGAAEVLGGYLLFFRKTKALGLLSASAY